MKINFPFYIRKASRLGWAIQRSVSDVKSDRAQFVDAVRGRPMSMLSPHTLKAIHMLSGQCKDAIVEIGAYVGGATVTILHATQARKNLVVTIEEPVEHPSHPEIPTYNSVDDLHKNIRSFGLEREGHYIISGASFETWVLGDLLHRLLGRQIGLMVWDADACFDRDLVLLSPFMREGCILVVDDYDGHEGKSGRITRVVDRFVKMGVLQPIAYLPWATWFGRLKRKPTQAEVKEIQQEWAELALAENPYYQRLTDYIGQLSPSHPPSCIGFEQRKDFWCKATAWKG